MRLLRWLLGGMSALAGLLLVAAGAAWIWAGSEGSARWALEQLGRRAPVTAEGVTGSLRGGAQLERLAWSQDGLTVEARQVQLAWEPLALVQGLLHLQRLQAQELRIEDRRPRTGQPPQLPDSLVLPLRVQVDEVRVGRLAWAGAQAVELRELAAGYGFDGTEHHLELRSLQVLDGRYLGDVKLAAREPFALQAQLRGRLVAPVPGGAAPVPLVLDASAAGRLAALQARLRVQGLPGVASTAATRATVTASLTPFAEMPVREALADLEGFDAGALWPAAPHTLLSGRVSLQPQDAATWTVEAELRNALPGPWDRQRVPFERVQFEGDWRPPQAVLVRELDAQVGGGRLRARGAWQGTTDWRVDATLAGVHPSAVHGALAALPLSGRATVRGEGAAIAFDTELHAADGAGAAPSAGALELRALRARGRWAGGELSLPLLEVRAADAKLDAALELHPQRRSGRGRADLEAPGLRLRAVGSLAARSGGGQARASLTDAGQAQRWLQKLPGLPPVLADEPVDGRAELQAAWQGGWEDPTVQATLTVPQLQARTQAGAGPAWAVRDTTAKLDGRLADARLDVRGRGTAGAREATLELTGRGGQRSGGWQGQLATLALALRDPAVGPGPWRLQLRRPVDLRWAGGRLDAGAGEAALLAPAPAGTPSEARIAWDPVRWQPGQLRTAGRITGLPLAWVELATRTQRTGSAFSGDLVVDGQWDVQLGDTLHLRAELARTRGDLSVLAETGTGTAGRVQAGVREARVVLESEGEAVTLSLRWDSERAGSADGRLRTRLAREGGGWSWPADAPLSGNVRAQLPRLGVWSLLAPPGWRLRGSLAADVAVAGTREDPMLTGTLRADDLALRSVVDGVALQDGRLRARLDGRRLLLEEFVLHGAGEGGGTLSATGEGSWQAGGAQVRAAVQLDRLRASARADRELSVSGQLTATADAAGAQLRGGLRVDRARIQLPDEAAPRLGDDVAVRNLPAGVQFGREAEAAGGRKLPVVLAIDLDLGPDFRLQGRGIETRLAGSLAISGESLAEPRLVGEIRTIGGEYRAYGQDLDIERGVLRFTGPVDNPALEILAIRPRTTQRVGVQVSGTAQAPFVRLYAEPDLPEAEKLSWLVLGRSSASSGAESALLQQAAVALLQSRRGGGTGKGPAGLIGLDELGFSRSGPEGPAVTLGKRLGRNLYASYERSLSGAVGTLFVFYDLSRRVTVRAQTGERSAVDLIFTFSYD